MYTLTPFCITNVRELEREREPSDSLCIVHRPAVKASIVLRDLAGIGPAREPPTIPSGLLVQSVASSAAFKRFCSRNLQFSEQHRSDTERNLVVKLGKTSAS